MKYSLLLSALFLSLSARADFEYSRTDFKYLFNNFRYGQVEPLPWAGSYWPYFGNVKSASGSGDLGSGINHQARANQLSPAQKYDECFGTQAAAWEEAQHSCKNVSDDDANDCKTWYGHCNGWTGAALNNPEPIYSQTFTPNCPTGKAVTFNYIDIKALMSELWLDVWASFEGTGLTEVAGPWIFHPNSIIASQVATNNQELNNYDAYWDVTPKQLFYLLTNYVGMKKTGLALDRFTGSEIWNQPLIAYRLLPIDTSRPAESSNGRTLYPVVFGLKLYWANDEVSYDFQRSDSLSWAVTDSRFSTDVAPNPPTAANLQDMSQDGAVKSRYMQFILYFDKPVVSYDGKQIVSAGKIRGDGIWMHALEEERARWYPSGYKKAQIHPDFIWRADRLVEPSSYANKHITARNLYGVILGKTPAEISQFFGN